MYKIQHRSIYMIHLFLSLFLCKKMVAHLRPNISFHVLCLNGLFQLACTYYKRVVG